MQAQQKCIGLPLQVAGWHAQLITHKRTLQVGNCLLQLLGRAVGSGIHRHCLASQRADKDFQPARSCDGAGKGHRAAGAFTAATTRRGSRGVQCNRAAASRRLSSCVQDVLQKARRSAFPATRNSMYHTWSCMQLCTEAGARDDCIGVPERLATPARPQAQAGGLAAQQCGNIGRRISAAR